MSQTAEEIKKHVKVDITVLLAFAALTLLHVAAVTGAWQALGLVTALTFIARAVLVIFYFAFLTKGKSFLEITLLCTAFCLIAVLMIPFSH